MRTASERVEPKKEPVIKADRWLYYIGGVGLLGAMGIDTIAVLGRHIGVPLLGSIELVQAAILVASSTAMLSATLANKHAMAHILVNHLGPGSLVWLQRVQSAFSAIFFCALAVGSIWIYLDLRDGYEESEVLHIPYAPLRILCIVVVLAISLIFVRRMIKGRPS
jgi:TRAP-type C4-dicarboxylate transport system permease small subunit